MILDQSAALFERGNKTLIGAVNSPVRAFKSVGGQPVFIQSGTGSTITDADGNNYIDLVNSYGPLILGNAHPAVKEAVVKACELGFTFGASTEAEIELAEMVCDAFDSIDKIRFVNSGTEATLSAVRVARAYTGRNKIIKFSGCYHGHSDAFLVAAGSGLVTLGIPDSAGVPAEAVKDTLVADYNNIESVKKLIAEYPEEIAAVIFEPVAGNMGVIIPEAEFIRELREVTEQNGILLIADEVMTGFRKKFGGAQDVLGFTPDLTCLGKVIGGGFPVGAYGGRQDIMDMVAPLGPVYQAGTLSGNPIAMAAGITTMKELKSQDPYQRFEDMAADIERQLLESAERNDIPLKVHRFGSMINPFFTEGEVRDFASAKQCDTDRFARFFRAALENGLFLPPSQFEAWFLSSAISDEQMDTIKSALDRSIQSLND